MKIKEFDEKVRIGSKVIFAGKIRKVVDINRRTHEAIIGKAAILVRCSEFELYNEENASQFNEMPAKMGRPSKPIIAIFPDGRKIRYRDMSEATEKLSISKYKINNVIYGKSNSVNGILFRR